MHLSESLTNCLNELLFSCIELHQVSGEAFAL